MIELSKPKPGYWYINRAGKLIKVRLVVHEAGLPAQVLFQFLEGGIEIVSIADWQCLDLMVPRSRDGGLAEGTGNTLHT